VKISELIDRLEAICAEHGDVHVAHNMEYDGINWVEEVKYIESEEGDGIFGHQEFVEISGNRETIGKPR
jgi:uncharacterized protein YkuJ